MDSAVFQAVVTAAVVAIVAQISTNGANGIGNGTNNSNQGESQGRPRECPYKDFTNYKPKPLNGSGFVIAFTQWFKKTESVFEICAYPEERKVKFVACTFADGALSW